MSDIGVGGSRTGERIMGKNNSSEIIITYYQSHQHTDTCIHANIHTNVYIHTHTEIYEHRHILTHMHTRANAYIHSLYR